MDLLKKLSDIKFKTVEEVLRKGQPNEFVWKHAVLDRMGFTTKAYPIPAITKEAVDDFPFDETFYVTNTKSELQDFYDRHIKVSNDDIPDEDELDVVPAKKPVVAAKSQPVEVPKMDLSKELDDLNDIPAADAKPSDEEDIDALLDGDDEESAKADSVEEVKAPVKKEESKEDPTKGDPDDIDALLDGIL